MQHLSSCIIGTLLEQLIIHTWSAAKVNGGMFPFETFVLMSPPNSNGLLGLFLGAAAGSPYIVFKLTFSYGFMLRIYNYIYI